MSNNDRFGIQWRDEYPSHPWVPANAVSEPDTNEHTMGGITRTVYTFTGTGTKENILSSSFEIPHDYFELAYDKGLAIEVHAHFRPTTNDAGDIKFFFDWEYSPVNAAPQPQSSLSFIKSVNSQQYYHLLKSFGNLPDLSFSLGDKIGFNIRRDPDDAEDTYGGDVILEQVALHIPMDSIGSNQIYSKDY